MYLHIPNQISQTSSLHLKIYIHTHTHPYTRLYFSCNLSFFQWVAVLRIYILTVIFFFFKVTQILSGMKNKPSENTHGEVAHLCGFLFFWHYWHFRILATTRAFWSLHCGATRFALCMLWELKKDCLRRAASV